MLRELHIAAATLTVANIGINLHTARCQPRYGFLVDTGASATLMGTGTLLSLIQDHIQHSGFAVIFSPSENTFTGIDGVSTPSVSSAAIPLGLAWPKCWTPYSQS